MEQNCGYGPDSIPQLHTVSDFLHNQTGWRLRPVMGLLTNREFFNALAFRVFHSTQYVRHSSQPGYTPEPDVIHDTLGHCPLFCDPDFADFSQEIGLASLGASEEDTTRIASIYWYTVEFGLCKEAGAIKAYGAGLLSSFKELQYSMSMEPKRLPFDPPTTSITTYDYTKMNPQYFVTESFEDAKQRVRQWAASLDRPVVRYNPYTENMEILDTKESLRRALKSVSTDLKLLADAVEKLY